MSRERDVDRKIAKAERDCAALGISSRSRMQAAAASRSRQFKWTLGNSAPTSSTGNPDSGVLNESASHADAKNANASEMSKRISPTRNIVGYAERYSVRPEWRESMEQFRSHGTRSPKKISETPRQSLPTSPSTLSSVISPASANSATPLMSSLPSTYSGSESLALDSYRLELGRLKKENHRLRLQICTPAPITQMETEQRPTLHKLEDRGISQNMMRPLSTPVNSAYQPLAFEDLNSLPKTAPRDSGSMEDRKQREISYVIRRVSNRRRSHSRMGKTSRSNDIKQLPPQNKPNTNSSKFSSTMDTLRKREKDLKNIFIHYSACDTSVQKPASIASLRRNRFWNESQFKQFLREFELLSLFGLRAAVEIFRMHATPKQPPERRGTNQSRKGPLFKMTYDQYMWCLSSLCNELPSAAGAAPEQRAAFFLVGLDKGLATKIAMSRSTIRIARPNRSWISNS